MVTIRQHLPGDRRSVRRGSAALELALTLPLLITIVFGCVDFGRFGVIYITLTNAVRNGAGVGCMKAATPSTMTQWRSVIRTAVTDEVAWQSGFDATKLTVSDPELVTETSPKFNRVRVRASYRFTTLVPWPFIPSTSTITRQVEMRVVRP